MECDHWCYYKAHFNSVQDCWCLANSIIALMFYSNGTALISFWYFPLHYPACGSTELLYYLCPTPFKICVPFLSFYTFGFQLFHLSPKASGNKRLLRPWRVCKMSEWQSNEHSLWLQSAQVFIAKQQRLMSTSFAKCRWWVGLLKKWNHSNITLYSRY